MKFLVGLLIVIAFILIAGCVRETPPPKTYAIYSMDVGQEIEGSFSLGSVYIETDIYYYYHLQDMDGGYHLRKAPSYNSRIFRDANVTKNTAYVIIYDCYDWQKYPNVCESSFEDGYDFHVPIDTITKSFNGNMNRRSSDDDSDDYTTTYIATQYMNPSNPASPMYYHG